MAKRKELKTFKQLIEMQKWLLSLNDKGHKIPAFIIYEKLNPIIASYKKEIIELNEKLKDIIK